MEPRTTISFNLTYPVDEVQHVIPVRCGDARDAGAVENQIVRSLVLEYAARGVKVIVSRVTIAGAVVNKQSYIEIKDIIKSGLSSSLNEFGERARIDPGAGVLHRTVVQISGHADVKVPEVHKLVYNPETEVKVVDHDSKVNCGMSHTHEAWKAMREVLYKLKPEVMFFDKTAKKERKLKLDSDEVLFPLLKSAYAHEGESVVDFLTSIDLIKQPLYSKKYLRKALDADNELERIPIHINCGIINYRTGLKIRIDDNLHVHTLLDDMAGVMRYVMEHLPENHPEKIRRSSTQKPVCGLICAPDIPNPRETLIRYINLKESKDYDVAGSVFLATGTNVLNPFSSFGSYKLGGICYSIMNLGIRDYYVLGKDSREAHNIRRKVTNDPILNTILEHLKVRLHVLTVAEVEAQGINSYVSTVEPDLRKMIHRAIKEFPKDSQSVLNRPIQEPAILALLD